MTESLSIPRTASRGEVGERHLLVVQTFDIARLTTHPVPLVPGTFIAVSGQGPKGDSNGSGKTSFLGAVSILLGDPQWRMDTQGGKTAAGILFRPDSAGIDPSQKVPPADHGFVAGVFADFEDPAANALTVWVRISTSAPYIEARWADGIHLAQGKDEFERLSQAEELWQAVKRNGTVSARRMSQFFFGDAPRCLTYLDTPLRPAAPSLLSQQMTEMEPRDIGASLIALSGSKAHLDDERAQRGKVLEQRRMRDECVADGQARWQREQAELDAVASRDAARASLDTALGHWQGYLAGRYLAVLDRDRELDVQLVELRKTHATSVERVGEIEAELNELKARTDLASSEERARRDWDLAKQAASSLRDERTAKAAKRSELADERRALLQQVDGWDGSTPEDAALRQSEAETSHAKAKVELEKLSAALDAAQDEFDRVGRGRSGTAGLLVDVLEARGVTATSLMDVVTLADEVRAVWEPRLAPWRDAVIVSIGKDADDARALLTEHAGAQIIQSDPASDRAISGVSSRLPIGQFLGTLEERFAARPEPDDVHDAELHLTVSGGFADPITGREAMLRTARQKVDEARLACDGAVTESKAASALLLLAKQQCKAAHAAARLGEIAELDTGLANRIAELDRLWAESDGKERKAQKAWEEASDLLRGHADRVRLYTLQLDAAKEKESQARDKVKARVKERESLKVELWRGLWQSDEHHARGYVAANSTDLSVADRRAAAVDDLSRATAQYGIDESVESSLPDEMRQALLLRLALAASPVDVPPAVGLPQIATPLHVKLDGMADSDRLTVQRVEKQRREHAGTLADLERELADQEDRHVLLQSMISQRVEAIFNRISDKFDSLDIERGGCGAELHFRAVEPPADGEWVWEVSPRWKRSSSGTYVPYREVANGAQVKVYAVQLVLAAVLADADTHGRVLVLDELGNSLGEVNRKDVLGALKRVAAHQRVTILGTCQDSVLVDAADVCGALLWFSHASTSDAYNRPTRAWAFNENSEQVDLTADWIKRGTPDE
ncbi:hypothetical protein [Saccharothrix sp. NRRL B-16314]|uniref:hypothetical protein n=1 Tax=Saccharothrix sp. NRRL B-16314 TaxID=1463825 RepID=UPI000525A751|nr:hypothetical protein [Saccharothrix sp. NRRL B-16314]